MCNFCNKKILNSRQNIKTIPDISFVDGKILHNSCVKNFVEQEKIKTKARMRKNELCIK